MKNVLFSLLLGIASASNTYAQCDDQSAVKATSLSAVAAGKQERLATHMTSIASSAQLTQFMKMTAASDNPLMALSPGARARFIEGLTFNDQGLTGYRYTELENELSPTQISKILSLLGAQKNTNLFKKAKLASARDQRILSGKGIATQSTVCDSDPDDPIGGDGPGGGTGGDEGGGGAGAAPTVPPPTDPRDYVGYRCAGATCKPADDYICTHNCK